VFSIGIEGMSIESVVALKRHTLSSMIYTVDPVSGRDSASTHSGEEFVHVLSGNIKVSLNAQEYLLKEGDSLSFRSTESHFWLNNGEEVARILWIYTPLVQS